jgi:hypothetical protein
MIKMEGLIFATTWDSHARVQVPLCAVRSDCAKILFFQIPARWHARYGISTENPFAQSGHDKARPDALPR